MDEPFGILLVEDDAVLRNGLRDTLVFHGYRVREAESAATALELWRSGEPDLVVLDLSLPDHDGLEVCRRMRAEGRNTAVLMLTARDLEAEKVLGFSVGADDYVTKPFGLQEVLARIQALLRRCGAPPREPSREPGAPAWVRVGEARVCFERYQLEREGVVHALTPREQAVLRLLVSQPGRVFSRDEILDRVWGEGYDPGPRTVDNFLLRLRQKVEADPAQPQVLRTIRGAGYTCAPEGVEPAAPVTER